MESGVEMLSSCSCLPLSSTFSRFFIYLLLFFYKYGVPYYINFLLEYGNNGYFFSCPDFFDLIAGNKTYGH